jgi:hypothetical protein
MEKHKERHYVKRTQRYSICFKLQIVQEIERGRKVTSHRLIAKNKIFAVK